MGLQAMRVAAVTVLLTVLTAGCAITSARPLAGDESVGGPEWKTTARRGVGAATAMKPALLIGVTAVDQGKFDRVVFDFDGERPGYRVAYGAPSGPAADRYLRITLEQVISGGDRHFTPELTAVHDVSQRPDVAGVVETIVIVGAPGSEPPPFRVGLSVGIFYIDVAHADELA